MLKSNSNKKVSSVLTKVLINIQNGNSISTSFYTTNKFSKFFVSMIRAGELSGNLDMVMNRLSNYYGKEYKIKSKTKSMLVYPVFLIILTIISSLFIFITIIPNFQMIFENNGTNPPLITRLLIQLSAFIRKYYIFIILFTIFLLSYTFYKVRTSKKIKNYLDIIQLKIPFISKISQLIITTKFARAFYILNKSGVEITESIEISSKVVDNYILSNEISKCKESIKRGNSISESLSLVKIFPKLFLTMIQIGEETGSLDKTLYTINEFYDQELEKSIDNSMRLIEPVTIVFVAIGIGGIVMAMLMPMFDAISII